MKTDATIYYYVEGVVFVLCETPYGVQVKALNGTSLTDQSDLSKPSGFKNVSAAFRYCESVVSASRQTA